MTLGANQCLAVPKTRCLGSPWAPLQTQCHATRPPETPPASLHALFNRPCLQVAASRPSLGTSPGPCPLATSCLTHSSVSSLTHHLWAFDRALPLSSGPNATPPLFCARLLQPRAARGVLTSDPGCSALFPGTLHKIPCPKVLVLPLVSHTPRPDPPVGHGCPETRTWRAMGWWSSAQSYLAALISRRLEPSQRHSRSVVPAKSSNPFLTFGTAPN